MVLTLREGGLSSVDTVVSMLDSYGQEEMKDRLHLELLLSRANYKSYIATNERGNLVGLVLYLTTNDFIWLDFYVVRDKYKNLGYEEEILNHAITLGKRTKLGIFLEVLSKDEDTPYDQMNEKVGFMQLEVPYVLSSEYGDTSASLYFYPSEHVRKLTGRTVEKVLEQSLLGTRSNIFTIEDTITRLKRMIPNYKVYYRKTSKVSRLFGLA